MKTLSVAGWAIPSILADFGVVLIAVLVALITQTLAGRVLLRLAKRTPDLADDILLEAARRPVRAIAIVLAILLVRPYLHLSAWGSGLFVQAAGIVVPGLLGWLAIALLNAGSRIVEYRNDVSVADNLTARRRRTRSAILNRILVLCIGFVAACLMLLSIPGIRTVGLSLLASAGIAALAVGAAAQPALKNLIAGIQMAFTEPIRLDDVVIVDGEWGRVEDIRLTYVAIALWDERRLIVPVSRFLDQSFQNWTRSSAQLLGSTFLYLDPAADIDRLRVKAAAVVEGNTRWDGRFHNLQVTDAKPDSIEVRILATARDASTSFDLRCDIREALYAFLRAEMPEALPRHRIEREG